MTTRNLKSLITAAILSIAGFVFCIKSESFQNYYFNSDTLYMPSFFRTLVNNAFESFQFSHLPNIVPDAVVIIPLLAIHVPLVVAYGIYSCLIYASLVLSLEALGRSLTSAKQQSTLPLVVIVSCILFAIHPIGYLQAIVVGIHGGSFVISLFCFVWAHHAITSRQHTGRERAAKALIAAIVALVTFSDELFIAEFVMPLAAASCVYFVWGDQEQRRRTAAINLVVIAAAILGRTCLRLVPHSPFPRSSPQDLIENAHRFYESAPLLMVLSSLIALAGVGGWTICVWRRGDDIRTAWLFIYIFAVTTSVAGLMITILAYLDFASYRYAITFFWWPLILCIMGVHVFAPSERIAPYTNVVSFGFICILIAAAIALPKSEFWGTRLAACLHEEAAHLHLHAGLAGYWTARPVTKLSSKNIIVSQVTEEGLPMFWINNLEEYLSSYGSHEIRKYDFVIMKDLDPAKVTQTLGRPSRTFDCGGYTIWKYDRPKGMRQALSSWLSSNSSLAVSN